MEESHISSSKDNTAESITSRPTPLPKMQIFIVVCIQICEAFNVNVLFPFLAFMVEDMGYGGERLGFYAGMLAASFCAAQFTSSIPWGIVSDMYGRKPAILFGTLGAAVGMVVFGTAKTFSQAMFGRLLSGLLSGNLGVLKSFLGEITDESNRGAAFSYLSLSWAIGCVMAPLSGGLLSKPSDQFPSVFPPDGLFHYYPYLLPCLVGVAWNLFSTVISLLYMRETRFSHANAGTDTDVGTVVSSDDDDDALEEGRSSIQMISTTTSALHSYSLPKKDKDNKQGIGSSSLIISSSSSSSGYSVIHQTAVDEDEPTGGDAGILDDTLLFDKTRNGSYESTMSNMKKLLIPSASSSVVDKGDNNLSAEQMKNGIVDQLEGIRNDPTASDEDTDDVKTAARKHFVILGEDDEDDDDEENDNDDNNEVARETASTSNSSIPIEHDDGMPQDSEELVDDRMVYEEEFSLRCSCFPSSSGGARGGMAAEGDPVLSINSSHGLIEIESRREAKVATASSVLKRRVVVLATSTYGMVCASSIVIEETIPLFLKLDVSQGGLSFSSIEIGILLSISGFTMMFFTFFFLPAIARNSSKLWMFRRGVIGSIPVALSWPLIGLLYRYYISSLHSSQLQTMLLWPLLVLTCVCKSVMSCFAFTAVMILINHSVTEEHLGVVNGLGQSLGSLARAVGPALGGALWSIGTSHQMVFLNFLFTSALMMGCLLLSNRLPSSLDHQRPRSSNPEGGSCSIAKR